MNTVYSLVYSQTSLQWPPWRQKKVAAGEVRVSYDNFFREYNMFFVLHSCLLCSIIMVIQSYVMYRDKIHKKL